MISANIYVSGIHAGRLEEITRGSSYRFIYNEDYTGDSVSLLMPTNQKLYDYDSFPPFFDGLLPEGAMLEALLKRSKIDADDYLTQLITVGKDLIGNVTVEATS
jgi:serine/threonine-protein kinase HipA